MNKTTLNSQKEKHSMLSLRRATSLGLLSLKPHTHFYPRSPCGERRRSLLKFSLQWKFLSTLSLRRATHTPKRGDMQFRYFYPRSPCGERQVIFGVLVDVTGISIHALLAESDHTSA